MELLSEFMPIVIEEGKDWFLRSKVQGLDWGPFDTEDLAWRYLFGRESTAEEREQHERAGWSTFQALAADSDNVPAHRPARQPEG